MRIFSLSKSHRILFPLSLVLFQLAVYISNDMIQPAMLGVVEKFNASIEWVPISLTAYLAGGVFLQWLFGPLSDIHGRRPVMLSGVLFFIINCLAILLVSNIEQFMIMRFLQGIGLGFVGAVGYATIQEAFDEIFCVKIIALMANVALIAPLLGPLAGTALINILPWQGMFVITAILGLVSFIGLWFFMPETITFKRKKLLFIPLWHNYKQVLKNSRFICGALAIGFANLPLLAWIGLSPVILINREKLSTLAYALLQIPVFGALITGNLILSHLTGQMSFRRLIKLGGRSITVGLMVASISTYYPSWGYLWIIAGLSIYSFGLGMSNACLTRLTLFSSEISKGTASAAMGIISMTVYILGIELSEIVYLWKHEEAFNLFNLFGGFCRVILVIIFIRQLPNEGTIPTHKHH